MATYAELFSLRNDSALRNKVMTACIVAAEVIMNEDGATANHANRLVWAKKIFANPGLEADRMLMAVLAANRTETISNIQSATDSIIQANIDAHVNLFADGS